MTSISSPAWMRSLPSLSLNSSAEMTPSHLYPTSTITSEQFKDKDGKLRIQAGDEIEVMMESTQEREGYVVLSRERAKRLKVWDDIESAYERQSVVPAVVLERIKGGLAVDIGVRAFLPGSQVDGKPGRNLDALIGREISC